MNRIKLESKPQTTSPVRSVAEKAIMKYEYKVMDVQDVLTETQLNELGQAGWRLIAVIERPIKREESRWDIDGNYYTETAVEEHFVYHFAYDI